MADPPLRELARHRQRPRGALRLASPAAALAPRESKTLPHPQLDAPAQILFAFRAADHAPSSLARPRTFAGRAASRETLATRWRSSDAVHPRSDAGPLPRTL